MNLDPTPTYPRASGDPLQTIDDYVDVRLLLKVTNKDFNGLEEIFKAVERVVYELDLPSEGVNSIGDEVV